MEPEKDNRDLYHQKRRTLFLAILFLIALFGKISLERMYEENFTQGEGE